MNTPASERIDAGVPFPFALDLGPRRGSRAHAPVLDSLRFCNLETGNT